VDLISRKEAEAQGLNHYYTGKPCINGHLENRHVKHGGCLGCYRDNSTRHRKNHPDAVKRTNKNSYQNNVARERIRAKKWFDENKERRTKWQNEYREMHREHRNALCIAWCHANLDSGRARQAKRRALKQNATPPWVDLEAIKAIYKQAIQITKETGGKWHVDHIIPLNGVDVCGLHVPWNLRVIPAKENIAKKNKLLPEFMNQLPALGVCIKTGSTLTPNPESTFWGARHSTTTV
jgi:hypothetical protein